MENQNFNGIPEKNEDSKTVAILSYCTLIGFIIAIVMNSSKKSKLGAFHLRQVLGIIIFVFAAYLVVFILSMVVGIFAVLLFPVIGISTLVFIIMGIIAAANEQMKPTPLIGGLIDKMLGTAFE